jgi:DNA (cytosine-5)-methyltransferase 1
VSRGFKASPALRAAEFFAGFGLMRLALEDLGVEHAWANDIDPAKADAYRANFGDRHFVLGDVRDVPASSIPAVDIATASFPCIDLSLAGARRGLGSATAPKGTRWESSMFWEFARLIEEMGDRRPPVTLCENVYGFVASHGGRDLREAIAALNGLGYSCDVLAIDARHFVPQSRPRVFIVGMQEPPASTTINQPSEARPAWAASLHENSDGLRLHTLALPPLPVGPSTLAGYVEDLSPEDSRWWPADRLQRFLESLTLIQRDRLAGLQASPEKVWRTAYRRTRHGRAVWEIRGDGIAGCLRTARGGSSKQALVEVDDGAVRVRWMTPLEYARLMGAPRYILPDRPNQAFFGFGDAVCVPVVRWLCEHYIVPAARPRSSSPLAAAA